MSFLENLGVEEIGEDADAGGKMPVGTHVADVLKVAVDEKQETIGIQLMFRDLQVSRWMNLRFKATTPEKTTICKRMAVKQLRNAGNVIKTDSDVPKAIDNLEGAALKVTISNNKNNPQYQNYFIDGNLPRVRTVDEAKVEDNSEILPF